MGTLLSLAYIQREPNVPLILTTSLFFGGLGAFINALIDVIYYYFKGQIIVLVRYKNYYCNVKLNTHPYRAILK